MAGLIDVASYGLILLLLCASARTKRLLHMEEHLAFYSSYHQNRCNIAIHLCCIWPILWSALAICDASSPFCATPPFLAPHLELNAGLLVAAIYALYYLALDREGAYGLLSAAAVVGCYSLARAFNARASRPVATAAYAHAACWIAQFVGHGLFEGRAPALFENLAQALLMAPHFVLVESCCALGLRGGLCARVQPLVARRLEAFSGGAKRRARAGQ